MTRYAELQTTTNFSFLRGASKAEELMLQVHHHGKAVVSSGNREEMERDVLAMQGYNLWATMEQA